MTREEQIHEIANAIGYPTLGEEDAFECGARWADANPVNPWKSVKEELPKYQKRYFTRMEDEDGGEHYAYIPYLCDGKWWYPDYLSAYKKLKVTHWMPIPERQRKRRTEKNETQTHPQKNP